MKDEDNDTGINSGNCDSILFIVTKKYMKRQVSIQQFLLYIGLMSPYGSNLFFTYRNTRIEETIGRRVSRSPQHHVNLRRPSLTTIDEMKNDHEVV